MSRSVRAAISSDGEPLHTLYVGAKIINLHGNVFESCLPRIEFGAQYTREAILKPYLKRKDVLNLLSCPKTMSHLQTRMHSATTTPCKFC